MIIELFGPPGGGKSTFAHVLTTRLLERGCPAELIASARPQEDRGLSVRASPLERLLSGMGGGATQRVVHAVAQASEALRRSRTRNGDTIAAVFSRSFSAEGLLWSLRLSQYALRLQRSWDYAASVNGVVIFDQAVVQLLLSYMLHSAPVEDGQILAVIAALPKPDLVIKIDEKPEVIARRLHERAAGQSYFERLLEQSLEKNMGSIQLAARLEGLLQCSGMEVRHASSADESTLEIAAQEILDRLASGRRTWTNR